MKKMKILDGSNKPCPKVTVIILVYNSLKWLEPCLASVLSTDYPNYEVLVVDNKSVDGSVKYIENNFRSVKVIKNKKNYGFAEGNNIGIRHALKNGADYVVLLNPDTKVDSMWLMNMVGLGESNPKIAVIGGCQYDYEGDKLDLDFVGFTGKNQELNNDLVFKKPLKDFYLVTGILGACFCVKKEVFLSIGLLDPFYFMYHEESDFCRRAKMKGFGVALATKAVFFHQRHWLDKKDMSSKIKYLICRNYLIFILKDPENEVVYNLKSAFIWTNLRDIFRDIDKNLIFRLKIKTNVLLLTPYVLYKRFLESQKACYL